MTKIKSTKTDFVECLRRTPIVELVCQKTGVSRATYYRWRHEDEQFREDVDAALEQGRESIDDLADSHVMSAVRSGVPWAIKQWQSYRARARTKESEPRNSSIPHNAIEKLKNFLMGIK